MLSAKSRKLLDAANKTRGEALVYDGRKAVGSAAKLLQVLRAVKELGGEETDLKQHLRDVLGAWHGDECRRRGKWEPMILVETPGDGTLQVQFRGQYNKIPAEREAELREELGSEKFERYFQERAAVKLRRDVAEDETALDAFVAEVRKLLGEEWFAQWFETQRVLVPTEAFTRELSLGEKEMLGVQQVITFQERRAA